MQPDNSTLAEGVQGLFRMYVDNDDSPISGTIHAQKVWEPGTTKLFRELFKSGMSFVDCGAHFGYYSLLAAKLGARRVVAFEPARHNFGFLLANIELNGVPVEAHRVPLWDVGGVKCKVEKGDRNTGDSRVHLTGELDLETAALDDLFKPGEVDFLKLDCQGSDCRVLRGAKKLLAGSERILLLLEDPVGPFDVFGCSRDDFFEVLRESGLRKEKTVDGEGNYLYVKP